MICQWLEDWGPYVAVGVIIYLIGRDLASEDEE
jgi:hypothetical protein